MNIINSVLYKDLCLKISIKSVINIDGPPICSNEILEPGQGATE